jgi:hypothetical protein
VPRLTVSLSALDVPSASKRVPRRCVTRKTVSIVYSLLVYLPSEIKKFRRMIR